MKSIYNAPLVKVISTTALTNLEGLLNVEITGVLDKDAVIFDILDNKWKNKKIVNSFNSRTGDVLPTAGDYSITDISGYSYLALATNVNINSPTAGQVLKYNAISGKFENASESVGLTSVGLSLPNIFAVANSPLTSNGTITASLVSQGANLFFASPNGLSGLPSFRALVLADLPSISLTNLSDTLISGPTNGQFLSYNGSKWINSTYTAPVSSVFGRTGAIVATSGDYTISQITNSSTLSNSANINISSPIDIDFLTYDLATTKWINKNINVYKYYVAVPSNNAINPVIANTFYVSVSNNSYTFYYGYNFGERVFIHCGDSGTQTSITFPAGGKINGISGPITLNSPSGYIEFINRGQLNWEVVASRPTWFYGTTPLIQAQTNTANILDFNISGPTNGQFLSYNSGSSKWINSTYTPPVSSVFGRTGTVVSVTNDYSISQITNSSVLADSTNINISAPSNGDILSYNSTSTKWENINPSRCAPTAEIYQRGDTTTYTQNLATQNTFYIFNNTTTLLANSSGSLVFNSPSNGAIKYTGTSGKYFHTAISISCSSNIAARNYQLAIFINGTAITGSYFNIDFNTNNVITSTAFHKILQLNNNDTIDIRIADISGNNSNITVNNFNFVLMACCN